MKAIAIFAALAPLAAAMPSLPFSGTPVTDPVLLAELQAKHAASIEHQASGNIHAIGRGEDGKHKLVAPDEIEKRQVQLITLIGGFFAEFLSEGIVDAAGFALKLAGDLDRALQVDPAIWNSPEQCRIKFTTHSGGEEKIKSYPKGTNSPDTDSSTNKGWINPASTAPPVMFFTDKALGSWSTQFTATDGYAWSGIKGTQKCHIEGLCNPQFIFYRNGYNLILNAWQSQGVQSDCYYHQDCRGMCDMGVKDQFSNNGVVWGGDCAVPCINDANQDIPGGSTTPPTGPSKFNEVKIMVVGDSISHGMESDYTWRYRIFEWLKANSYTKAKFVGPYSGTHGPVPQSAAEPSPPPFPGQASEDTPTTTGNYNSGVSSDFYSSGHGAWWGRQAKQVKATIHDWVATYQPDYILFLLGFNDMGWFVSGPDGLIGDMGACVEYAREAKSNVNILVGNVVDRTFIDGRDDLVANTAQYNSQLRATIHGWFRYESPIAYVDVNSNYGCKPADCPNGYDGLHPSAMGEYRIAQSFAGVMKSSFGFQCNDFVVPDRAPARIVATPGRVTAQAINEGIMTAWAMAENARGYHIRSRIKGMADWWSSGVVYPSTTASVNTWVAKGQEWEYQVATVGDHTAMSAWSGSVYATADPKTAPPPSKITSTAVGSNSIQITWSAVTGYAVERYGVIVWDQDTPGAFINIVGASGTSYTVGGLISGHRYGTWVVTYTPMTGTLNGKATSIGGVPGSGGEITVGGKKRSVTRRTEDHDIWADENFKKLYELVQKNSTLSLNMMGI